MSRKAVSHSVVLTGYRCARARLCSVQMPPDSEYLVAHHHRARLQSFPACLRPSVCRKVQELQALFATTVLYAVFPASERAAMLEALEKLQPNLAALVERPGAKSTSSPERAHVCASSLVS